MDAPRFDFIEDGFGATVHELGHAMGLTHDVRDRDDIMGQGFRHLQVNYLPASAKKPRLRFSKENARLLGVSRYLVPATDRTDNTPPSAQLVFRLSKGRPPKLMISIKATDDRELARRCSIIVSTTPSSEERSWQERTRPLSSRYLWKPSCRTGPICSTCCQAPNRPRAKAAGGF